MPISRIASLPRLNGNNVAFVTIELTSMPGDEVASLQKIVSEAVGSSPENVLICTTHTFSALHFQPPHLRKTAAEQQKNDLLFQAVRAAVEKAATEAVSDVQDARFGYEIRLCDVNVNRDIPTAEGWWLGSNETGPSNKSVPVFRFEALDGEPIAFLLAHVQN
jgi:hypothetical protein